MNREDANEQGLEAILQDWALRSALPAARSESIRLTARRMPEPVAIEQSIAWWHQLFGRLDTVLGQTIDMSRYLRYKQTA